jgi:hypothetical protein
MCKHVLNAQVRWRGLRAPTASGGLSCRLRRSLCGRRAARSGSTARNATSSRRSTSSRARRRWSLHAKSARRPFAKTWRAGARARARAGAQLRRLTAGARTYEESDEFCPHCDNHYVVPAKIPQAMIGIQGDEKCVGVGGRPPSLWGWRAAKALTTPLVPRQHDPGRPRPQPGEKVPARGPLKLPPAANIFLDLEIIVQIELRIVGFPLKSLFNRWGKKEGRQERDLLLSSVEP